MGVSNSADLTARQFAYSPKIDKEPKTIPIKIPKELLLKNELN